MTETHGRAHGLRLRPWGLPLWVVLCAMLAVVAGGLAARLGAKVIPASLGLLAGVWLLADPDRALLAYVAAVPFSSAFVVLTGVELAKFVFAVAILSWLGALGRRKRALTVDIPLLGFAFVAWCLISGLASRYPGAAAGNALRLGGFVLFVLMAGQSWYREENLRRAVVVVLLPSVPLAALGTYQFLTGSTIWGLGLHPATGRFVTWKGYVQASGVFDHPNVFATQMFVSLCLALGLLPKCRSLAGRVALFVVVGACAVGLVLSFSRSGWIGFAAALVVLALWYPRFLSAGLLMALLVGALVWVLPRSHVEGLQRRITPEMDASMIARLGAYKTGWEMFVHNPVTGVGLGSFYRRFLDYKVPDARFPKNYIRGSDSGMEAHSTYLQLLAETGVVGLGLFLAFNIAVLRQVARLVRHAPDGFLKGLAMGLASAFAALVVQNAFNSQEYLKAYWVVVALVAGASECLAERQRAGLTSATRPRQAPPGTG